MRPLALCSRPCSMLFRVSAMSMSTLATTSRSAVEPLQTRLLGSSSLRVTEACLGTMTWGVQNSEADAHDLWEGVGGRKYLSC